MGKSKVIRANLSLSEKIDRWTNLKQLMSEHGGKVYLYDDLEAIPIQQALMDVKGNCDKKRYMRVYPCCGTFVDHQTANKRKWNHSQKPLSFMATG